MKKLNEEVFLAVYWGPDKKTLRESAEELLDFLLLLKAYQPHFFGQWYGQGWSKKEALSKKMDFTYDAIRTTLFPKRMKDEGYKDIGFTCGAWNGKDEEGMSLSAGLGYRGELFPNNFMLHLPHEGPMQEYYTDVHHQRSLLKLMIDYWQADFAKINDPKKEIYPPYTALNLPKESPIAVTRHRKITSSQEGGYLQQMVKSIKKLF